MKVSYQMPSIHSICETNSSSARAIATLIATTAIIVIILFILLSVFMGVYFKGLKGVLK